MGGAPAAVAAGAHQQHRQQQSPCITCRSCAGLLCTRSPSSPARRFLTGRIGQRLSRDHLCG
eukprot:11781066-Alexandrium_andersonii.AAC.1